MAPNRLGVLGGTFNPVHTGHLFAAEYLAEALGLSRVLFVPCGNPPHKRSGLLSSGHRYRMLELAIQGNRRFSLSRMEIQNPKVSYSINTIRTLRTLYPAAELYFLIGADNIDEIPTWKDYRSLLAECRFAAISRRPSRLRIRHPELKGRVRLVEAPVLEISSSEIRDRLWAGRTVRYLLPEKVLRYIERNSLYANNEDKSAR